MKFVDIYRVKTFVVPEYVDLVMQGILSIDDLKVGNYRNVMWQSKDGMEQFVPSDESVPTEGEVGEKTTVTSFRIEFSIPRDEALLRKVIEEGIYPNHPWDEPVIQVSEEKEARKHE
ncbi:hypothetical protein GCM10010954_11500 [Halobacillus andaensis]|uniref:Uncharacterized protein n=1 Tax=Halobacillus andaensis TaxID=1176239 RepID=A0A917B1F6_HALAA|nr:hypothetical protein [Halobacillus andaensis]MBP2003946.1 hypothetical protein [Halobacillus andaensis]GGF14581.1 hypothetical protein GCM10010954_11500 [Halobacillus andaensis]